MLNLKELREERRVEHLVPNRFQTLLKSVEIYCSQVVDIEPVASRSLKAVELY
jgi:hypothetical protein